MNEFMIPLDIPDVVIENIEVMTIGRAGSFITPYKGNFTDSP